MQSKKTRFSPHSDEECPCSEQTVSLSSDIAIDDFLRYTRRILVVGEIDDIAAANICSSLQMLSIIKKPIYMYINSPGGSLHAGYAIIDQILSCCCPVVTIVRGIAHSMGAIITAFGTKGCRYATPNSSLMLHSVTVHDQLASIENHEKMFNYTKLDYDRKITTLSRRMGIRKKKLNDIMSETTWMQPKQAIKIGIIDGIWTPAKERAVSWSFVQ